jgi:hypothetical protein
MNYFCGWPAPRFPRHFSNALNGFLPSSEQILLLIGSILSGRFGVDSRAEDFASRNSAAARLAVSKAQRVAINRNVNPGFSSHTFTHYSVSLTRYRRDT